MIFLREKIFTFFFIASDGIIGDAANRKTGGISFLIPTLLTSQWHQDVLYRLVCRPASRRVVLTVKTPEN